MGGGHTTRATIPGVCSATVQREDAAGNGVEDIVRIVSPIGCVSALVAGTVMSADSRSVGGEAVTILSGSAMSKADERKILDATRKKVGVDRNSLEVGATLFHFRILSKEAGPELEVYSTSFHHLRRNVDACEVEVDEGIPHGQTVTCAWEEYEGRRKAVAVVVGSNKGFESTDGAQAQMQRERNADDEVQGNHPSYLAHSIPVKPPAY